MIWSSALLLGGIFISNAIFGEVAAAPSSAFLAAVAVTDKRLAVWFTVLVTSF